MWEIATNTVDTVCRSISDFKKHTRTPDIYADSTITTQM